MIAKSKQKFEQEAQSIARLIRTSFSDVSLPAEVPIGALRQRVNEQGCVEHYLLDDEEDAEMFFKGGNLRNTPKHWADFVGEPLHLWLATDEYSHLPLSPQARAYYLPAYLLTALMYLVDTLFVGDQKTERVDYRAVHSGMEMLTPPPGLDVWHALMVFPRELLDPFNKDMSRLTRKEEFLRFVGQFNNAQKRAIKMYVQFVLETTYFAENRPGDGDQIAALKKCWIEPALQDGSE
ncbi:MAG: hypothetical protein HY081_06975 [Gammaproteobacteria bacterium]|nr:hypothetical protein [Gammaproteobacteria bacterium]